MSAVAHSRTGPGPGSGGLAARRAVIRWAGRVFRREWRQQLLVVTLLTLALAAAVGSITLAYNATPADDAAYGSASHRLEFDGSRPRGLEARRSPVFTAAAEEIIGIFLARGVLHGASIAAQG